MFTAPAIWLAALGYLGLLFAIASYADRCADRGRSLIANPYVYALSLAVYATSWTFYGSVGRAADAGVGFLPIYLGPTLVASVWWLVLRKMIRISKVNRITSVADFIGWRYGKSGLLAGLVSIVATVGVIPYIALQLKAVSTSFAIMLGPTAEVGGVHGVHDILRDTALYVTLVLAAFSILFGTRHLDATERHEGVVAAIAFESLVKLAAFLAVGIFVTWGLYDGPADIFVQAARFPRLQRLMTMRDTVGGYEGWFGLVGVSMLAFLCLPRQFQMGVVENVRESHLLKATWLFPLYMFVINLFVLPVAFGGRMLLPAGADADTFVLTLPLAQGQPALALFVFLGGISACTGMIVVETLALSTMICNDLVMPVLLRSAFLNLRGRDDLSRLLLGIRRGAILLLLVLGYAYYRAAGEAHALVSIGLMSFAAVAQFAPAMLIGMYWKGGTAKGAGAGILIGFAIWAYTLLLPSFAESGWLSTGFIDAGPFGIDWLRPRQLFGYASVDSLTQSVYWSLMLNVGAYLGVSVLTQPSAREHAQALLFVDAFRVANKAAVLWRGSASMAELTTLMRRFLGPARSREALAQYAATRGMRESQFGEPDGDFVHFVEKTLAGAIGAASAHVMVSTVVREEPLHLDEVFRILDESSQVIAYSRQLEEKSLELERTGRDLSAANERLRAVDRVKDDVLSTVTHELRTPLASIRALTELLHDDPGLDAAQRTRFLHVVIRETARLTRLVNQVLDLAKVKAGRMTWHASQVRVDEVIEEAVASTAQLLEEQHVALELDLRAPMPPVIVDRDRLLQVVLNLLSNAIKFCRVEGGRVRIVARSVGGAVRVEVHDNGAGIPKEDRELIFERFAQLTDPVAGKPNGSGLGLAISRHIVQHFGGQMWTDESTREGGACFVLTLPLAASGPPVRETAAVAD